MSLAHQSIATINSPQFINLQPLDINPLMSACEIKVLYIGENRNRSFISKEVAAEMAKTLRGAPIVGYYKKDKQDFADHGQQMILDDEGIHFNILTKPYGFVSPDAKVWFKDFEEQDQFNNKIIKTYLMTTGYLWTGQFEQSESVINQGKPLSMELEEKSLQGHWATNIKENMDFFIINDAIFSKLCILGDDVEPCFEGSGATAPQVSASFTLDDQFKHTLFTMMEELKDALKGGHTVKMGQEDSFEPEVSEEVEKDFIEHTQEEIQDNKDESMFNENNTNVEEVEEVEEVSSEYSEEESQEDEISPEYTEEVQQDDNDMNTEYTQLKEDYEALKDKYSLLEQQVIELRSFKLSVEDKQKDDLINQFYMLSDEDKKDVIENKSKYSYEEIESKLAVICFKKKVNFNLDVSSLEQEDEKNEDAVFTLDIENGQDSIPEWIKAVESTMKSTL